MDQFVLFVPPPVLPEGSTCQRDMLSIADAQALIDTVHTLSFKPFEFHGYTGKRQTVSFGWTYDFEAEQAR